MKTQRFLVWLFAGIMLADTAVVLAQTTARPVEVRESGARAILAGDSIHLQLPFATAATQAGRAVVWTLSPTGAKSAETAVEFAPGARRVSASLPWPKDEKGKGKKADEIGWYRIGYRIDSTVAKAKGVLSIGTIAPNLLTLRLALDEKPVAGKPLTVRVFAENPVTHSSFRGVQLEGALVYDADAAKPLPRKLMRASTTGLGGEAALLFPVEGAPGDTATLKVTGTLVGVDGARSSASIDADISIMDRATVRIESDKMLHKPGETVHLRALVFDDAGRAAAGKALKLTIEDSEAKTLLEEPLVTNQFGIASYDWKTGPQLAPGTYQTTFEVDGSSNSMGYGTGYIALQVRRYDLPEFAVSAAMDRGFYLDGQTPVVKLHAGYLFGKAVAAGSVRVERAENSRWDQATKKMVTVAKTEQTATLDEHGDAELKLDEADEFADLKSADPNTERYRDVQYRAYVTHASTGRTEPRSFTLRLTHDPVHIYLRGLGGNDHEGDYIVSTSYADGEPAVCKVTLDWLDAQSHGVRAASVTTSRYGLARVHLRYPAGTKDSERLKVRLTAQDAEERTSLSDSTVHVGEATSIWISVGATLMKPRQNIEAAVHGLQGSVIDVDAVSVQGVMSHQQIHMMHASEPFTVAVADNFRGVVTLVAYSMNSDSPSSSGWQGWSAAKSVVYPEDRELKLKLTGLQASYAPGAEVDAGVDVRAAGGFAAPSALGVSVADAAVEQRAVTEEDANQRWSAWNWWRNTASIGGVSMMDLQKTDMSKPISDDLQLVAEAAIQNSLPYMLGIESEDYDAEVNKYTALIQKQLKPLGDAILAARPAQLPATLDGVRAIADAAGLDPALLLDPWGTPYKVKVATGWNTANLNVLSAGPDKRFDTADDLTVNVVERNLFALPGERMSKMLEDTDSSGEPLPATVDELKRMARAGGLDLDRTFDPDGNSFQYRISVGWRSYAVQVFRHDAPKQENGRLAGAPVWASPYINYFSRTEVRMEAAIKAWADAGHMFPTTEAEARAAFTAAGINFDVLRDPLGQPFQLHTEEQMSYTRMEKVKAGGKLEETSKPVTHRYRSIQVLRAPSVVNDEADNTKTEVVAQFLHPMTE